MAKVNEFCNPELSQHFLHELCLSALEEDKLEFETLKKNILHNYTSFIFNAETIKRNIRRQISEFISRIEENKREILLKLESVERFKYESWKRQAAVCDKALEKLNQVKKYSNFKEINHMRQMISVDIGRELDFIEDDRINYFADPLPNFGFGKIRTSASPNKSQVLISQTSYSKKFNFAVILIKDCMGQLVEDSDYRLTVTFDDCTHNSVYFYIENISAGKLNLVYYPEVEGKYLLHVHLNLSPVGDSPYEIIVKHDQSQILSYCPVIIGGKDTSIFSRLWGVCSDFEGRIFVTDRGLNCVKIIGEDGELLGKFGKEGTEAGEFAKPTGITVDKNLRRVIIADKDNHRIQIFDYEGNYITKFGQKGEEDGSFCYPWDVAVNQNSQIIVSDSKNRRIQLFTESGKFLWKFVFKGKYKDIELPRGVAFTPDGGLLVTDFNKHHVLSLDKEFTKLKLLGSEGSLLSQFSRPQSVDVFKDGKIAVADCKNHRVQIFWPNGQICAVFGSHGEKPGELVSPQGVCFLSDGRLAVAELGNCRIQIFRVPVF